MEEIKYLIWLAAVLGSSSAAVWQVIHSYDSAYQAFTALKDGSYPFLLTENQRNNINKISLEKADKIISRCAENNISVIPYNSPEYPEILREIHNFPPVLYVQGDISCLSGGKNITCIGTRQPCEYTKKIISMICSGLAGNNFTTVSGFALGSDITAHMSAVRTGGKTACVLGCGIDVNYPVPNHQYRKEIIESGGVFISEFPPETPAFARNFPQRNRILSALSRATIVFEAAEKSGSLSTARLVKSQGRKLFCIPPADITDSRYAGNIHLLRTSAAPLYSVADVLEFYGTPEKISVKKTEIKSAEKTETEPEIHEETHTAPETEFTPIQRKILAVFGNNDVVHMDNILDSLDMDISQIIAEIMDLRIIGAVEEITGNRYRKTERGKF